MGDIAVPLIGAQMTAARAKRLAPADRLSSVAVMAEPDRVRDIRHVVGDHGAVAAEPVARKDQPVAADILAALVRQRHPRPCERCACRIKPGGAAVADQRDIKRLDPRAQGVDQFAPRP